MINKRFVLFTLCLTSLLWGCSGGDMSLTEYVDRVNAINDRAMGQYEVLIAGPRGGVLVAEGSQLADFTPQDLQVALERMAEVQAEALESAATIEPPEQIAEYHSLFFVRLPIEALAARAGTTAGWEELSDSAEMAAYRAALVADQQVCFDFQAALDATAERGIFADTPWIPGELKEIVEVALGCAAYPEHPEDLYRPPPAATD